MKNLGMRNYRLVGVDYAEGAQRFLSAQLGRRQMLRWLKKQKRLERETAKIPVYDRLATVLKASQQYSEAMFNLAAPSLNAVATAMENVGKAMQKAFDKKILEAIATPKGALGKYDPHNARMFFGDRELMGLDLGNILYNDVGAVRRTTNAGPSAVPRRRCHQDVA